MTRRDYVILAEALAKGAALGDVIGSVKAALKNDNPRFNDVKFEEFLNKSLEKYTNERTC